MQLRDDITILQRLQADQLILLLSSLDIGDTVAEPYGSAYIQSRVGLFVAFCAYEHLVISERIKPSARLGAT